MGNVWNNTNSLANIFKKQRCNSSFYTRDSQTCSMYEPHMVKSKLQRATT